MKGKYRILITLPVYMILIVILGSAIVLILGGGLHEDPASPSAATCNVAVTETQADETVWIPRTGSKYHRYSTCSRMRDPEKTTKREAERLGFEPCHHCYG